MRPTVINDSIPTVSSGHLYHMTPVDRLADIARDGLQPGSEAGASSIMPSGHVYAWRGGFGPNEYTETTAEAPVSDWALLRFRASKSSSWERDPEMFAGLDVSEPVRSSDTVRPEDIQVYAGGKWKRLNDVDTSPPSEVSSQNGDAGHRQDANRRREERREGAPGDRRRGRRHER